jgi:serine/threonine protein phosphatase 1
VSTFANFWKKPRAALAGDPAIPPGHRVYAIGDVHGRDDLLELLLAQIEDDHASRGTAAATIIFLGDLIDRGPASRQVIERAMTYRPPAIATVFIAGNHEDVLCRILAGEHRLVADWLRFGGAECACSYGLDGERLRLLDPMNSVEELRAAIPQSHRAFLESFCDTFSAGDYLFVHAGIRPGIPVGSQRIEDLRWIRRPFLDFDGRHEQFVVHGHTISAEIDEAPGRIGIDTGAYASGVLTAIGLEGTQRWALQGVLRPDGA